MIMQYGLRDCPSRLKQITLMADPLRHKMKILTISPFFEPTNKRTNTWVFLTEVASLWSARAGCHSLAQRRAAILEILVRDGDLKGKITNITFMRN